MRSILRNTTLCFVILAFFFSFHDPTIPIYFGSAQSKKDVLHCDRSYYFEEHSDSKTPVKFEVDGKQLYMRGYLDSEAGDRLVKILDEYPEVETLIMVFIPGSTDDEANVRMGRLIRDRKLNTCVPRNGIIESAGVDLFLAGVKRHIHSTAIVGVHDWVDNYGVTGSSLPKDHEDHDLLLDYFKDIGVNPEFYWFTLRVASPENIYFMSRKEMEYFNFETRH